MRNPGRSGHCIARPEWLAGQKVRVIRREFQSDVEGFLPIGRRARIECFLAEPDIAPVSAGAGEAGGFLDIVRAVEEFRGD